MSAEEPIPIKIYTQGEIEIFLSGDRREVDRLLLEGLNNLSAVLLPHAIRFAQRERELSEGVEDLGGLSMVKRRAAFVDTLIEKQTKSIKMIDKINESAMTWALLIVIGFVLKACWEAVKSYLHLKGSE